MTRTGILALILFAVCIILGIASSLVYRSLIKKTGDDDPSSVFLKIISSVLIVVFILCIFVFFAWLLPLLFRTKSFFFK